ncbi:N-terminal asparagine amidohydrolase isoform X2 [Olea europaea subsp. europaea]|uniref:N-terminal asparagine amidohydrolase isoform X2 n=1 Tax=Olea europaea subsp. europaea TaxID=158383 RepID=A0A8S0QZU1_OLEEU|nr:N-terminal asparagine amidohydrolase isoform X2 [Olea europaea subsp. europaea]
MGIHMDKQVSLALELAQQNPSLLKVNSKSTASIVPDPTTITKGNGQRINEFVEGTNGSMRHKEAERWENRNRRLKISGFAGNNPSDWVLREETALPFFNGFMVETSTGSILLTNFDRMSRCPDEVVRRVRVTACFEDPN